MKSYVTTKAGDAGKTRALDGSEFPKSHPMMEAVGTLDTLRTQTALLRLHILEKNPEAHDAAEFLLFLLHVYFLIGSSISDPHNRKPEWRRGEVTQALLDRLESEQARMEAALKLPHSFIATATSVPAAQADIAASFARAFERRLVAFCEQCPEFDGTRCLAFVNRLSDYFFILARHLEKGRHHAVSYDLLGGGQ